ncbi:MAG: aminomethyl-transferring glycine dehydrogenase subunit GcvPA [Acidobacteriota bacterium]|nr:aminomethyl-transferring glycine dehydrogenase subunit GcvPA [Acidobacteriota bacterium]
MRYLPNSPADRKAMLHAVGAASAEELFAQIPAELRLKGKLQLPGPLSEAEILDFFRQAAAESSRDYASFLGAGVYTHYRPVVIDALLSRGEFLTAYTPYQAEISQGILQALFEFQTLITQLTGMEVANASLYDGSTATNEAALMAMRLTRRERVIVARTLHPHYREVVRTYTRNLGAKVEEAPYSASQEASNSSSGSRPGQLDLEWLDRNTGHDTAAVIVQSPNFFGLAEPAREIARIAHQAGALFIVAISEPLSLAVMKPPENADIVCGEAQSFGVPVAFGGPFAGFMATREKFIRQMPGRLVGETTDSEGRRGFVLTLVTREQFIRREKATSNICTSQSLCALAATIYMSLLGKSGLRTLAEHNLAKARYAASRLASAPAVTIPFTAPFFNEFVVRIPGNAAAWLDALREEKIIGGLDLSAYYPELENHLLVAATECVRRETIDKMAAIYHHLASSREYAARF